MTHSVKLTLIAVITLPILVACGGGEENQDVGTVKEMAVAKVDPAEIGRSGALAVTQSVAPQAPRLSARPVARPAAAATSLGSESAQTQVSTYAATFTGIAFYVDSATGNDTFPGTLAQPWKTLARAASSVLQPGDALLLKCGSAWRETVEFKSTFAPKGGVLIGAYGNCTAAVRPEINGAKTPSSGWKLSESTVAGDIFVADVSDSVATLVRGSELTLPARHPNFTAIESDFSLSQPGTSPNKLTLSSADRTSIGDKDINGATAVIRTTPHSLENVGINSFDITSGTATLSTNTALAPIAGAGYYLQGKRWMLDAHSEWWHDPAAAKLYYFKGRIAPRNPATIEYTRPVTTLSVRGIPNLRIEHVRVINSGEDGIRVTESGQSRIVGVEVKSSRVHGINAISTSGLPGTQGINVESSTVIGAGVTGIAISLSSATVNGNAISDIGNATGALSPVAGIRTSERDSIVSNNTVQRSGNTGITFSNRNGAIVSGNIIRGACSRLSDCGAIYGWGTNVSSTRTSITQNQISAVDVANTNGAAGGAPELVAGIYLDEGASNVDVVSNYISQVRTGINLHKANHNTVVQNTVFSALDTAFRAQSSGSDPLSVRDNQIRNNTFFIPNFFVVGTDGLPKKSGGVAQVWVHQTDVSLMFTGGGSNSISNNVAIHLGDASSLRWRLQSGTIYKDYEAGGWAAFAPTDKTTRPYRARMASVQGTQLIANGTMETSATPWTTYTYQPGAGIASFSHQSVCGGSCARFTPATPNDVLMQIGLRQAPASSNLMFVRYRAIGGPVATSSRLEVRENLAPYNPAYMEPLITLPANEERRQEVFFNRTTNADLRLSIKGTAGASVMFDDIELFQVTAYQLVPPSSTGRLLVNPSNAQIALSCAEISSSPCDLLDENGNAVGLPVMVPAQSGRTVFFRPVT